MKTLKASAIVDDEGIGAWHIESEDCPLEFVGDRPPCVVGISTNMQGPVPLNYCKHANKDGAFDGPSGCQVECMAAPSDRCPSTGELFGEKHE